jgi:hypothetical protein
MFSPFARFASPVPPTIYIPYGIALLPTFRSAAGFVVFIGISLSAQIVQQIKLRTGVRPSRVKILEDGVLPRATHKAKLLVDAREIADTLKGAGI